MASGPLRTLLHHLHRLSAPGPGGLTDAQLLERFVAERDEAAFEVLVWRHGPLVYNVCRRVLGHADDVEDAFQATFLALVRKAAAIRNRAALGGWLYQVAHRVALRALAARRPTEPYPDADLAAPEASGASAGCDLRPVLDEEVRRLPAKYRDAVVLFYLSGHTTEEAARQLGCPRGTVLSRLAWARERLRQRLARRGVALPAGALAAWLAREGASASAPALLTGSTVRAATGLATGKAAAAGVVSARAATLMEGALRSMFLTQLKTTAAVGVLATVLGLGFGLWGGRPAAADTPERQREDPAKPAAEPRTRIALINLSYVIKHCDEFKAYQGSVQKQVAFFQEREKVSRARIDDLKKELAAPGLSAFRRDGLEMDLKSEQRKMQDDQEEAKRKLTRLSDEQTVALYKKVREAAERYARAHDFDLVLHYSDATPDEQDYASPQNVTRKLQAGACLPLYWKAEIDISKAVVGVLNAAHRGPPKETPGGGAPDGYE
jgi:RNA polymerase sigma factor (sigma-70 family)